MATETNPFLAVAFDEARKAALRGEVPVGAVVTYQGEVIAQAGNQVEGDSDPTAHAEMLVLRQAGKILGTPRLTECDLWVTLEPCPICAAAIASARIRRLYFGAYDPKSGGVEHGPRIFQSSSCHHKPEVIGGLEESAAAEMMKAFFREKRAELEPGATKK